MEKSTVYKVPMQYAIQNIATFEPICTQDMSQLCAHSLKDSGGELLFESNDYDRAKEYFDNLCQSVAKWDSKSNQFVFDVYILMIADDNFDEVQLRTKAPFVGYRMCYQQQMPLYDDNDKLTGYKAHGLQSYVNLFESISVAQFIKQYPYIRPINVDCNMQFELIDADGNTIEQAMLYTNKHFEVDK